MAVLVHKAWSRGKWHSRVMRIIAVGNIWLSVFLLATAIVLVNYLAARFVVRWDVSDLRYYSLSDKTTGMLAGIEGTINVTAVFQPEDDLFPEMRSLLKEYEYEATKIKDLDLVVELVDPHRDLARMRELSDKLDVEQDRVIVFEYKGRKKYVNPADVIDYEMNIAGGGLIKRKVGFRGEQVFSSAILGITQAAAPKAYFVGGHGERDIHDYNRQSGYSGLARLLRRDCVEVAKLVLTSASGIPEDCDCLVIAGPRRRYSKEEAAMIADYLENRNGRLFLLADPGVETGLDDVLASWGVALRQEIVAGMTLTGKELLVTAYGEHRITERLRNSTTVFFQPRGLEMIERKEGDAAGAEDRVRVAVIAGCTDAGWAESDMNHFPPRFDEGIDERGSVPVSLAVERGVVSVDVDLSPTRLIVIGDSFFVANGALSGIGAGNADLFFSAFNWLVERESLIGVAPKVPGELRLDMTRGQLKIAFLMMVMGVPGCVALCGVLAWFARR